MNVGGSYFAMARQSRATGVGASCSLPKSGSPAHSDASFARSDYPLSSIRSMDSWLSIASTLVGSSRKVLRHDDIHDGG
jgi:hypothetical protein